MRAHTGLVSASNARLHVRDIGSGPPIVVLHGGPDFDSDYLVPELDCLAERFRLIYYDGRGRGRSADGVQPDDVTVASEMDDLEHLRRHFGLESWAVLGHSWGAVLAMEYASRHPDRLTHLILMNAAPASHEDMQAWRRHLRSIRPPGDVERMEAIAATAEFRAGDLEAESEYYRIHYRPAVCAPELLDQLVPRLRTNFSRERVLLARAIEHRLYEQTWSFPGYDLLPRQRHVVVPTLVIHGEQDFVPVDMATRTAEAFPRARLVVVPHCGHFAYLEAPDAVLRHVSELFTDDPTAPRYRAPGESPEGVRMSAPIVTSVDAKVDPAREADLLAGYAQLNAAERPAGLLRTELLRGQDGVWRIQSTWRDRESLIALRDSGVRPAAVELLERLGAEHSHAVFMVEQSYEA
ncbi:MAG: alpha/beta hydrolase [Candidatus Nanopelagicales bacterium]